MPDFVLSKIDAVPRQAQKKQKQGSSHSAQLRRSFLELEVAPLLDEVKRASAGRLNKECRGELASRISSLPKSRANVLYPKITTFTNTVFSKAVKKIDGLNPKFVYAYVVEHEDFEIISPGFEKQNYFATQKICRQTKKKIERIRSILPSDKRGIIHEMEDFLNTIEKYMSGLAASRLRPAGELVKSVIQSLENEGYDLSGVRQMLKKFGFNPAETASA